MLTTIALSILALPIGLFLVGCFWTLLGELLAAKDSRGWPSVSARIETSRVVRNYDCNRLPGYHCRVSYEFSIGDQDYAGDTICFGGFRYFTRRIAERLQQCYRVGASVMAYYKPDDPELSVLRPGFTAGLLYPVALFTFALAVEIWVLWTLGTRVLS
jgi:hypothetical protein